MLGASGCFVIRDSERMWNPINQVRRRRSGSHPLKSSLEFPAALTSAPDPFAHPADWSPGGHRIRNCRTHSCKRVLMGMCTCAAWPRVTSWASRPKRQRTLGLAQQDETSGVSATPAPWLYPPHPGQLRAPMLVLGHPLCMTQGGLQLDSRWVTQTHSISV